MSNFGSGKKKGQCSKVYRAETLMEKCPASAHSKLQIITPWKRLNTPPPPTPHFPRSSACGKSHPDSSLHDKWEAVLSIQWGNCVVR